MHASDALSSNESIAAAADTSNNNSSTDADKYFDPLQAACESQTPKLMEIALDGICTLIGRLYACSICIAALILR